MKKTKKIKEFVEVTEDIICNWCGKTTFNGHSFNHIHLHVSWGFDSRKDLEDHDSDLCERCYDKLINKFKIKPTIKTYSMMAF